MRFHAQNLNEKKYDQTGSILRHGRCWLDFKRFGWHFEWVMFKWSSIGLVLNLSDHDDEALGGHLSLGFVALYWGMKHPVLRRWMERLTSRNSAPTVIDCCKVCRHPKSEKMYPFCDHPGHLFVPLSYWSTNGRSIGIRWFDGNLWIDLWNDPMESRSSDPKWWHLSITPVDVIFGHTRYEEKVLDTAKVIIPMPEGGYRATVKIEEAIWRRPRWPWIWRRMIRSEITPDTPIPFPGKGENSWDCGEDATHSMTGPYDNPFDAAMALSRSVMKDRVKRAGWDYLPERLVKDNA